MTVLYYEGEQRIDKSLDIVKIINNLKYMKQLIKYEIKPSEDIKKVIYQNSKNTIDMDLLIQSQDPNHLQKEN